MITINPQAADVITISISDADQITLNTTAILLEDRDVDTLQGQDGAFYLSRDNHTGTQAANTITGLATVATSGSYNDLSDRPTISTNAETLDGQDGAHYLSRANHTGTQAISTVTGLVTRLSGIENSVEAESHARILFDGRRDNPHQVTSAQISYLAPFAGAQTRSQADKNAESISVKDFGAIGDGTLHTLQEWVDQGKFSGLAAIQVVMPFVTSLTQSIDWAATQYCLNNSKNIYVPKGKYVFSDVAKFPHNTTPFNVGTSAVAPRIFGDGVCTTVTRNDEQPATRIMNAEGTSTTQESDTANMNEACFSVHCPYAGISDLTIESSRVGIYFGQDFAQPFSSLSSLSKSNINRVQINRCGTGVLMLAAGGNHYVNFSDMHFTSCQIDVHQRSSFWWKITQERGDANNNRNCFTRIRSGRSRIAYWNQCGDTNTLLEWHGEGINHTAANNPYPIPDGLPVGIPDGSCMFVFDKFNQLNKVTLCNLEQVGYHVYNDGTNNAFTQNLINEGLVKNISPPLQWFGRYVMRFRGYGFTDNVYPDAFPELKVAGRTYTGLDSSNGTSNTSKDSYREPVNNTSGSYSVDYQEETGAFLANTQKIVPIWLNIDASTCASIEVLIVGRCDTTGQISSFNTKVLANAFRTTARALTRFGMTKTHSSRATYEGILDTAEANHISASVQKNATVPQILEIVLTCPFDLSGATLFIERNVMKYL